MSFNPNAETLKKLTRLHSPLRMTPDTSETASSPFPSANLPAGEHDGEWVREPAP